MLVSQKEQPYIIVEEKQFVSTLTSFCTAENLLATNSSIVYKIVDNAPKDYSYYNCIILISSASLSANYFVYKMLKNYVFKIIK